MTFRFMTDAEIAEQKALEKAVAEAKKALADWKAKNRQERSSLKVGDLAYSLESGYCLGTIVELLPGEYYSWRRIDYDNCISNNSCTSGTPSLGTREQAAQALESKGEHMRVMAEHVRNGTMQWTI